MNSKRIQWLMVAVAVLICAMIVIGIWLTPLLVFAADTTQTVTTSWTYSEEDQANISGFRIYDKDKNVVVNDIAPDVRTVDFERDASGQNAYYIVAFKTYTDVNDVVSEMVSGPSNIVVICDTLPIPINPEGFTIQ